MSSQPLFEHHGYPDHFAKVAGVFVEAFGQQFFNELGAQNAAVNQTTDGFVKRALAVPRFG
jgi:hypothetical protein